jgi:hypothetical protein
MPLAESRGRVVVARRGAKECLDRIGRVLASCSVENESAWTPVAVLLLPVLLLTIAAIRIVQSKIYGSALCADSLL